jgi:hypothetical protein
MTKSYIKYYTFSVKLFHVSATAQWFYTLLHVSAEIFSHHQGDLLYRQKQLVTLNDVTVNR